MSDATSFAGRAGRILAVLLCIGFGLFGLIRIGVGSALLAQQLGYIEIADLMSAVNDTREFLAQGSERAIIPLSVAAYFGYIIAMGVMLLTGAIGMVRRQRTGFVLFAIYLAMHGALFVNFLTINPKIFYLAGGIAVLAFTWVVRGPQES